MWIWNGSWNSSRDNFYERRWIEVVSVIDCEPVKESEKVECWLVSRGSWERNQTEEVLVVWWEPGQPGGTNHHGGLSATITLIWEARDLSRVSRPPQVTNSNSACEILLLLAYFTGQVWTEAKEIRSNFTYNLSWYRAITVITNVSLNGERNVDNSKVSNNELVNCPDEIVLHLLLQMWFLVLFPWHLLSSPSPSPQSPVPTGPKSWL